MRSTEMFRFRAGQHAQRTPEWSDLRGGRGLAHLWRLRWWRRLDTAGGWGTRRGRCGRWRGGRGDRAAHDPGNLIPRGIHTLHVGHVVPLLHTRPVQLTGRGAFNRPLGLLSRPLPAGGILGVELLQGLPAAWERHHARGRRNLGAAAQQAYRNKQENSRDRHHSITP